MKAILQDIAYARSGDKGANSNIGVIARTEAGYEMIKKFLTAESVKEHFSNLELKSVVRYELPNLLAFNFVLEGALGEGGSRSLYLDAQGKSLGQKLLQMDIHFGEFDILEMQTKITAESNKP